MDLEKILPKNLNLIVRVEESLLYDRNLILKLVKINGNVLMRVPRMQNDREIVLAAVKSRGTALNFASANLLNDYEIVLAAVKSDGLILRHLCDDLRANRDIVMSAVRNNAQAFIYACKSLRCDREIVLLTMKNNGNGNNGGNWDLSNFYDIPKYELMYYSAKCTFF